MSSARLLSHVRTLVRPATRRRGRTLLLLATCLLAVAFASSSAYAAAGDVGFKDGSTSGTTSATGTKRPESALWINDGLWWASMWDSGDDEFHILS
jgi:hypothetical protein